MCCNDQLHLLSKVCMLGARQSSMIVVVVVVVVIFVYCCYYQTEIPDSIVKIFIMLFSEMFSELTLVTVRN